MSFQEQMTGRPGVKRPFNKGELERKKASAHVVIDKVFDALEENWKNGCKTLTRVGGMAFGGFGAKVDWETNGPFGKMTITYNEDYDE